ncbi:hypothetical protein D6C93_07813 [Aureobasidium pullulans]|nr:hypothetical protein D6C93_07813 [Aureobasidium pullulans]
MAEVDLKLPELIPEMARYQTSPMTETVFGSMKEVIQHHLATCDEEKVDPHYFLVVADAEWEEKGIIAVNLDSGDPEEGGDARLKPDLFWMKIEESGLLLVNLQIANTDWYEAKENYEVVEEEPWTESRTELWKGGLDMFFAFHDDSLFATERRSFSISRCVPYALQTAMLQLEPPSYENPE